MWKLELHSQTVFGPSKWKKFFDQLVLVITSLTQIITHEEPDSKIKKSNQIILIPNSLCSGKNTLTPEYEENKTH